MADGRDNDELDGAGRARRRLLKLAVYVPPAVIGTLALNEAACQVASTCMPTTCQPAFCMPSTCMPSVCDPADPCMPNFCMPGDPCDPITVPPP